MRYYDPDQKIEYKTFEYIRHVYGYLKPWRKQFWKGTFFRIADLLMGLYSGFALGELVNILSGKPRVDSSLYWLYILGIWFLIGVIRPYSAFSAKKILFYVAEQTKTLVEKNMLLALFAKDAQWHEQENAGNKVKRIQNGVAGINEVIRHWCTVFLEVAISGIGMVFIIATNDLFTAVSLAIFLVLFTYISIRLLRPAAKASFEVNQAEEDVSGLYFESVVNTRTVRTLDLFSPIIDKVQEKLLHRLEKVDRRIFYFQKRSSVLFLFSNIFRVTILAYIVYGVTQGRFEVGFVAIFYAYFNNLWTTVEHLSEASQKMIAAKQQIARMRESFHDVPLTNPNETEVFPKDWNKIEVADVSFSYGAEDVLKNISFEVKKGEKVGIVGLSGAGKSTLFKLLLKERIPTHGSVSVEGVPIDTIKNDSYLANVSVVLQDTEVFNMTLRENIEIVRSDADSDTETLERALTVSHVADFLHKLPEGVETVIGEKGVKLSGGERQRLGIARAIYKNPDILLMDEATSHLDIESEKKIQASLHEFFQGVTAIVIAHRLTTIKEMDKILVIEEGRIVESGSFAELSKKKGRFYELWEKQQL